MPSNYRLPLKHFEKKSLKDRELYNSNLLKIRLWPLLTIFVTLLLLTGLGYTYYKSKNNRYQDIIISKSSNPEELFIGNCTIQLSESNNNYQWLSDNCAEEYNFKISSENKDSYSKISFNPEYYLQFNKSKMNIINSNLLIEPIINKSAQYLKKDQLKKFVNSSNIDLYGNCTFKTSCELVKVSNNNINYIKKGFLDDIMNIPDLKELKLIEDNKELFLEVIANNNQRYKLDLNNNSLQTL